MFYRLGNVLSFAMLDMYLNLDDLKLNVPISQSVCRSTPRSLFASKLKKKIIFIQEFRQKFNSSV